MAWESGRCVVSFLLINAIGQLVVDLALAVVVVVVAGPCSHSNGTHWGSFFSASRASNNLENI